MIIGLGLGTAVLLLAGGILIGVLLAVLGAGGSILLMPLLVSGAGLPTREAVPLSLLVVTLLALANVFMGWWLLSMLWRESAPSPLSGHPHVQSPAGQQDR